jgi:O-antigen/teichoic acid export membrane protein
MRSTSLTQNAAWSVLSQLLSRGTLVLASMILANSLDSGGFAIYAFFHLSVGLLVTYSSIGMGLTSTKLFAQWIRTDASREKVPIGTLWLLSWLFGTLVFLVIIWMPTGLLDGGVLDVSSLFLGLGVLFASMNVIPNGALIGLECYRSLFFSSLISALIILIGSIAAASARSVDLAIATLLAANLIQSLISSALILFRIGLVNLVKSIKVNSRALHTVFNTAGPMFVVGILAATGPWLIGRMILDGTQGEKQYAMYAIGLQWFSLALFLPGVISRVIMPRMVKTSHTNPISDTALLRRAIHAALVASALTIISGMMLAPFVGTLYGDEYGMLNWIIVAFLVCALPAAPSNTISNALIARDGQWGWLGATIVWIIVLFTVGYMTIELGVWSAPLSIGLASLVLSGIAFRQARGRRLL